MNFIDLLQFGIHSHVCEDSNLPGPFIKVKFQRGTQFFEYIMDEASTESLFGGTTTVESVFCEKAMTAFFGEDYDSNFFKVGGTDDGET